MKIRLITIKSLVLILLQVVVSCAEDDTAESNTSALTLTPVEFNFKANGGFKVLNLATDPTSSWNISSTVPWLSTSVDSGTGNKVFNIIAEPNAVEEQRQAQIVIHNTGGSVEIPVSQLGALADQDDFPEVIADDSSQMGSLTAVELTARMGVGWNIGNSLDAVGGETAWGNPPITEEMISAVKAAGFKVVRIPVAWSQFSDSKNYVISESWMQRVKQVVDWVIQNDMYAMVNMHWDGGWMLPTYDEQEEVIRRMEIMWQQIGLHFRDYDYRLLFAGSNEVMVAGDYGEPTEEYYTVQNSFNQTFVNTIRAIGGRNAYRYLVVQGFNTNIDHTVSFAKIPEDRTENRLLMEVHYYDPYNFTINESNDDVWQWGEKATDAEFTETWANESYADGQFEKMKTNFIDKGIGVILGEYGAVSRLNVPNHQMYRAYYLQYITTSAKAHGLVPIYWDNGVTTNHGFGLFDRNTTEQRYPNLIEAIVNPVP